MKYQIGFIDAFLMIEIYFCGEKINHGVSQNVAPLCSGSLCVAGSWADSEMSTPDETTGKHVL